MVGDLILLDRAERTQTDMQRHECPERNVSEPLISTVSRKFDIVLNIIFSDIAIVQNAPIGGTVAIISGSRDQITQAIAYLSEKNVGVEVIKDARVSE